MKNLIEIYKNALERIEKFGHSHGHGHGYTCANIAEEALKHGERLRVPDRK